MNNIELETIANNLINSGQTKQALGKYNTLYKNYQKEQNLRKVAVALRMIGVAYYLDDNPKKAFRYLEEAKTYFAEHSLLGDLGETYMNIGSSHENLGELDDALENLKEAIEILQKTSNWPTYGISLARLGRVYSRKRNFSEAWKILVKSLDVLKRTDHWQYKAEALMDLGAFYIETKEYLQAIKVFEEAQQIIETEKGQKENTILYAQIYALKANAYANLGNLDSAKSFYKNFHELSKNFSSGTKRVIETNNKVRETQKMI